jgi:hypothetical protein
MATLPGTVMKQVGMVLELRGASVEAAAATGAA